MTTWHAPTSVTLDKHGSETHPAWVLIGASRVSATPGAVLFDSDVKHQHFVRVTLTKATRGRSAGHDYLSGGVRTLFEIDMSEAQWASFVSSMNIGSGVPATLRRSQEDSNVPGLEFEPRLGLSMKETRDAASRAFDQIREARDIYEALLADKTATAKQKREALSTLHSRIENATSNVAFAGETLVKHTENVVQKARADIEAFVVAKAEQLGIDAGDIASDLSITAG